MATPFTFKNASAQADTILPRPTRPSCNGRKMPFTTCHAMGKPAQSPLLRRRSTPARAKAALQAWLDDKVEAPSGKRLVVTLGRDVGPATDGVLVAWAAATSGGTKVISFDQFIKG